VFCIGGMTVVACGLETGGLLVDSDGPAVLDASTDVLGDWVAVSSEGSIVTDAGVHDRESASDAPSDAPSEAPSDAAKDDAIDDATGQVPDVDSSPPPPTDAAPAPLLYDGSYVAGPAFADSYWVGFCVGVTGCFNVGTISACLGHMPQPLDSNALIPPQSMLACVDNAGKDCGSVYICLGGGSAPCDSNTRPDSCSGNVFNTCLAGVPIAVDCGRLGLVCSEGAGNAGCGFGDCYAWQEGQTVCAGSNYLVECHNGRYRPLLDCQVLGLTCGGSPAQCQNLSFGCAGVQCQQLFGSGSFQCSVDANGMPRCTLDTACTAAQADTCDSTGVYTQFCNDGMSFSYNCQAAHWRGCNNGLCAN
jgi:hypothetical protein